MRPFNAGPQPGPQPGPQRQGQGLGRSVAAVAVATLLGLSLFAPQIRDDLDAARAHNQARTTVAGLEPVPDNKIKDLSRAYPAALDVDAHLGTLSRLARSRHLQVVAAEVAADSSPVTRHTPTGPWTASRTVYTLTLTGPTDRIAAFAADVSRLRPLTALTAAAQDPGRPAVLTLTTHTRTTHTRTTHTRTPDPETKDAQ